MKKLIFLLLISAICLQTNAQYTDTVKQYLIDDFETQDFKVVNPDSAYFKYYRIAKKTEQGVWHVKVFFADSKTLHLEGIYIDDDLTVRDGRFYRYYRSGQLANECTYNKNKLVGLHRTYHRNGILTDSSRYKSTGMPFHKSFQWDEEGRLMIYGDYDMTGSGEGYLTWFYEDSSKSFHGKFAAGHIKDSTWTYYHKNGEISFVENFSKGELIDCSCYDIDGKQIKMAKCDSGRVYPMPDYNVYEYIAKNVRVPDEAKVNAYYGEHTAQVLFSVNTDGDVCCAIIAIGSGYDCFDKEALRVINSMPRWKPGKYRNTPLRTPFTLPVRFVLE